MPEKNPVKTTMKSWMSFDNLAKLHLQIFMGLDSAATSWWSGGQHHKEWSTVLYLKKKHHRFFLKPETPIYLFLHQIILNCGEGKLDMIFVFCFFQTRCQSCIYFWHLFFVSAQSRSLTMIMLSFALILTPQSCTQLPVLTLPKLIYICNYAFGFCCRSTKTN